MMMKRTFGILLAFFLATGVQAAEPDSSHYNKNKRALKTLAEGCAPATAQTDLNINNVRARILGGGDMWWDLNRAQYEVPKGSNKHSMFAGALWLGGIDEAGQLKLAAMTYRGSGVDYWTGPLDDQASVTESVCQDYDRHWVVYRDEVETHKEWIECKEDPNCDPAQRFPGYAGNIPQSIQEWPGNGVDGNLPTMLAPYTESDSNGIPGLYDYEWDYPAYDFSRSADCQAKENDFLYGDQTIWWVYNDKGNIHTESGASALGFEIRAQAFAFTSNDEVNNMTFNNYRILNKSSFRLSDTYFGTWFDPDIGNFEDDVIGSDIPRGLGYAYNGDLNDEGALGYGLNPPAIGFDFFQGPFADYFNGLDDDRDGCVDGVRINGVCQPEDPTIGRNERIIMSGFMYYNNGGVGNPVSGTTDPSTAEEFYRLLRSIWKDGRPLVIENPSGQAQTGNGDGYVLNPAGFETTRYAYPGDTYDTTGAYEPSEELPNGGWYENPDNAMDKRGLHSAGPFSLAPGALNFITTGTVWARNFGSSDLFASVNDVIIADDKAQQLFDNCFQVLDGPNAPDVEFIELDKKLVLNFTNPYDDNVIGYEQEDPQIVPNPNWSPQQIDSAREAGYFSYRFEGFQIFQVSGPDVGVDELYDPSQSRLIAQSDLKNDVEQLVNYTESPDLLGNPLTPMDMTLRTNNSGVEVSYEITQDAFATGDELTLINNKAYYFYVIAYAQNDFITFNPGSPQPNAQKQPYLAGRRNIGNNSKPYVAIPTKVQNRRNGTQLNTDWGDRVAITRLNGQGNGSAFLRIAQESNDQIVANFFQTELKYLADHAPVDVKVTDPFEVRDGSYRLEFSGTGDNDVWKLYDEEGNFIDSLRRDLTYQGEQIIQDYGFSISVRNPVSPGFEKPTATNNGIIGAERIFDDPNKEWLTGVPDNDSESPLNWILAGISNVRDGDNTPTVYYNDYGSGSDNNPDPQGAFENILGGTWAPVALASNVPARNQGGGDDSPGFPLRDPVSKSIAPFFPLSEMPNINVVYTSDPSKWSRVPVLEMGNIPATTEGNAELFNLRDDVSMRKQGNRLVPDSTLPRGWSYFPGYAVNVETGRRLNLVMGENSWLKSENGDDMLYNPSANLTQKLGSPALGGMHVLYVLADSAEFRVGNSLEFVDLTYQGDAIEDYPIKGQIEDMGNASNRRLVWGGMTWCTIGLLTDEQFEYQRYADIPTKTTVRLRVQSPYQQTSPALNSINEGNPTYSFDLEGFAADTSNRELANDALDLIRAVPNPYYGSSRYEDSQLDNIVKITNLPQECTINIFMTNGTRVRTIRKDNQQTYVEWDLKNDFNVPIASGVYIIHIDAGDIGEKVIKWVGSIRPADLNAF